MIRGGPRGPPLHLFQSHPALAAILVVALAAAIIGILIWSHRQDGD